MLYTSVFTIVFALSYFAYVFGMRQRFPDILYAEECLSGNKTLDHENLIRPSLNVYKDHGRSYANISFSIAKVTPRVMFRMAGYRVTDVSHRLTDRRTDFVIDKLSCTSSIIKFVLKKMKLKYNKSNCTGYPGSYNQPRFDIDGVNSFYKLTIAGIKWYTIEIELYTSKGVIVCIAYTLDYSKHRN